MAELMRSFVDDKYVAVLFMLLGLDLLLGVITAVRTNAFRLSYIGTFLKNDGLKVLAFFFVNSFAIAADKFDLAIPELGLDAIKWTAYSILMASLVGSMLSSLREIGILSAKTPVALAGEDTSSVPPPRMPRRKDR